MQQRVSEINPPYYKGGEKKESFTEKVRTRSISASAYLVKTLEYIFKLGAAIVLGIKYILQATPAKAGPVIQFRIDALKGLLG